MKPAKAKTVKPDTIPILRMNSSNSVQGPTLALSGRCSNVVAALAGEATHLCQGLIEVVG
jgi:hypothetical protein